MWSSVKIFEFVTYNAIFILSFFFISLIVLLLNYATHKKLNTLLFSSYRSSFFNPLTYLRLFTHVIGHDNWSHFSNNFLYILLIGPMIEEKYGTFTIFKLTLITAFVIGVVNIILTNKRILGASGIVFMFIILSSFVNIEAGKIPITLILIFIFYIINEIISGIFKKDNISHLGHLVGAICGFLFGFYLV